MAAHGVELVEQVIATAGFAGRPLRYDGSDDNPYAATVTGWVGTPPRPLPADAPAAAVFPSGRPVPPSLRRWMAHDTSLLRLYGWLDESDAFTPRSLGTIAFGQFGEIGRFYLESKLEERFQECFLLPNGSDSRRILVTDSADSAGECAVLALDVDDMPCAELMYPGFDVYLADNADLVELPKGESYSALMKHPDYRARMREHSEALFGGKVYEDCWGHRL